MRRLTVPPRGGGHFSHVLGAPAQPCMAVGRCLPRQSLQPLGASRGPSERPLTVGEPSAAHSLAACWSLQQRRRWLLSALAQGASGWADCASSQPLRLARTHPRPWAHPCASRRRAWGLL